MRSKLILKVLQVSVFLPLPVAVIFARPADNPPSLKMTLEILNQKYCRDNNKTFSIVFTIRMLFTNQSTGKLIVEKIIGGGEYNVYVAHDLKSLSERNYEYWENVDQVTEFVGKDEPEDPNIPGKRFTILAPGESIQNDGRIFAGMAARQRDGDELPHTLRSGDHLLRIIVETLGNYSNWQEMRKRWAPFGELIYGNVWSEPITFSLPSNPKFESCN